MNHPNTTALKTDSSSRAFLPFWVAIIPVFVLICLLAFNVKLFSSDAAYGPNQMALLFAAAVTLGLGWFYGTPLSRSVDLMTASIGTSLKAILILLIIGGLMGTWMIAGIVPAMIYYGLEILSPNGFLVLVTIICSIVSLATGSSWTTVGTVGLALMGIGGSMGFNPAMIAGAAVSGAYFGDKLSPLSDTTNLAPAMAGTDLYTHVRYMLWTTIPTYVLTLIFFAVLNYFNLPKATSMAGSELSAVIERVFFLSPWLLLVPLAVLVMVALRVDAVVALFLAMLAGAVVAVVCQPVLIGSLAEGVNSSPVVIEQLEVQDQASAKSANGPADGAANAGETAKPDKEHYGLRAYRGAIKAMAFSTEIKTGNATGDELLKGKGMLGMLNTIWLIVCAMCYGGAMEATGFLQRITEPLVRYARSTGSLVATTAASCIFTNVTASDQYISIVMPGRMFRNSFAKMGLAPQNLSRTLEDSGTVTSPLVPWNTCGAYMSQTLLCSTWAYLPFAAFCWISPLMTIAVAFLGIGIARIPPESDPKP